MTSVWLPREPAALATLAGLLALAYFGLFNHDFTVDGLRYAAQVEAGAPLFHPNHLIPNLLFRALWRALGAAGVDVRAAWAMQAANVLAGIATAVCLARALAPCAGVGRAFVLALLYAFGFAAWNFAQEPEVYMFPSFAVAVSLAVLWRASALGWGRVLTLGALAVFAVLCLQQYVFWYPALLALAWRADLGASRRAKLGMLALGVPLTCIAVYLGVGFTEGAFTDISHTLGWFLGYAWDAQHGFGTYRPPPPLGARVLGAALGLGNLVFAYEVAASTWTLALAAIGTLALVWLLAQAALAARGPASGVVLAWTAANFLFALWWESRDIEFLFPVWLGMVVLLGLGASALDRRMLGFALVLVVGINFAVAFWPQRDWPARYRVAAALAEHERLGIDDMLITEELNTVSWLSYFRGVPVRFLPGAVSAAMHASASVADARAQLDRALADGCRVYTTEPDERGRLDAIARRFGALGRSGFDGHVERDLAAFYTGLELRPIGVPGAHRIAPGNDHLFAPPSD